jgi:hypothetical protein
VTRQICHALGNLPPSLRIENLSTFSGGGTFFSATSTVAQELKKKAPKKINPSCLNDFKDSLSEKLAYFKFIDA